MSGVIAVLDANVLYPAALRDFLLQLATTRIYRAHWTAQINEEWSRNLLANRPDISADKLALTVEMMAQAVPGALVTGHENLTANLDLPDPADRHVLAAAITVQADAIVTINGRDFPDTALAPYGVSAVHPDDFIMMLVELFPETVLASARACRSWLTKPTIGAAAYLTNLEKQGLVKTATFLRTYIDAL